MVGRIQHRIGLAAALTALLGPGCAVDVTGQATAGALIESDGTLPLLDDAGADGREWRRATAGCEGRVDFGDTLAVASLEHGLVAVIDPSGDVVCVDSVEALSDELAESGHADEVAQLEARFAATLEAAAARLDGRAYTGDPHPEPNDCPLCGDPHPEPN